MKTLNLHIASLIEKAEAQRAYHMSMVDTLDTAIGHLKSAPEQPDVEDLHKPETVDLRPFLAPPPRKAYKRKPWTPAQRRAASVRMKQNWKKRRKAA